jgi:hypothetical protein
VQPDHRIRHARAARDDQHAGTAAAHAAVGGGHERGTALVAADDQADAVAVGERVGEAEIAFARHAIDEVDVMRFEALHQHAADRLCHRVFSDHARRAEAARSSPRL